MKALELADAYADACFDQALNARTEDPIPEQKRDELAAELRRLAAVEAELERIKALESVAWALRFDGDSRLCLSCVFDTEKEANEYAEQINHIEEVVPLYALGSKTA